MFSGGFAKGRTQRAQTGSAEGFEVSENPMGLALKRGIMGGSSKKSVGFAETPPRAANESDVEMATFASGSEKPTARKLTDIIGVPLPPADWEGYKDPKYKVQKKMKEDEDEIIRGFQDV